MHEAKKAGVASPTVFLVDVKNATIIMEYIDGKQIKELLEETSGTERQRLCFEIGGLVGKLHEYGVIHGDLTTSNIILDQGGKIYFIDFGLGEKTKEIEARGVDLHLMKRALQSTHFRFAAECLDAVFEGYCNILETEVSKRALDKIEEIERRGRYVAERKERE
jgi:TP53 regulating kinase-like protein